MAAFVFTAGLVAVVVGVGLWSPPAALVVLGALLMLLAVVLEAGAMRDQQQSAMADVLGRDDR